MHDSNYIENVVPPKLASISTPGSYGLNWSSAKLVSSCDCCIRKGRRWIRGFLFLPAALDLRASAAASAESWQLKVFIKVNCHTTQIQWIKSKNKNIYLLLKATFFILQYADSFFLRYAWVSGSNSWNQYLERNQSHHLRQIKRSTTHEVDMTNVLQQNTFLMMCFIFLFSTHHFWGALR